MSGEQEHSRAVKTLPEEARLLVEALAFPGERVPEVSDEPALAYHLQSVREALGEEQDLAWQRLRERVRQKEGSGRRSKIRKGLKAGARAALKVKGIDPDVVEEAIAEYRGEEEVRAVAAAVDATALADALAIELAPHSLAECEARRRTTAAQLEAQQGNLEAAWALLEPGPAESYLQGLADLEAHHG